MSRIPQIEPATATGAAADLLAQVHRAFGVTPNMTKVMANSPALLEGYLALSGALDGGVIPAGVRERLAVATAEANGCEYCLSAHSYIGANVAKVDAEEMDALGRPSRATSTLPRCWLCPMPSWRTRVTSTTQHSGRRGPSASRTPRSASWWVTSPSTSLPTTSMSSHRSTTTGPSSRHALTRPEPSTTRASRVPVAAPQPGPSKHLQSLDRAVHPSPAGRLMTDSTHRFVHRLPRRRARRAAAGRCPGRGTPAVSDARCRRADARHRRVPCATNVRRGHGSRRARTVVDIAARRAQRLPPGRRSRDLAHPRGAGGRRPSSWPAGRPAIGPGRH